MSDVEHVQRQQDKDLHDLFDQIAFEIEERQEYLEQIEKTGGDGIQGGKEIQMRVKGEIIDRVGEL